MTFTEFKEECYLIRDNAIERERIVQVLKSLEKNKYSNLTTVSDPTQTKVQCSRSYDDKVIGVMDAHERKKALYKRRLEQLPVENEDIRDALLNVSGVAGLVVMDYFILGQKITPITKETHYSRTQCYRLIRVSLKEVYSLITGS